MRSLYCGRCHQTAFVVRDGQLTCRFCFGIPIKNSYACAIVDNYPHLQCSMMCSSQLLATRYKSLGYCPRCNGFADRNSVRNHVSAFMRAHAILPLGVIKKEKKSVHFGLAYRVKIGDAMDFEERVERIKQ